MKLFSVTYEETRTRQMQVIAASEADAVTQARANLRHAGRSGKVLHAVKGDGSAPEPSGDFALYHLLDQPFIALGDKPAWLRDWVALAARNLPAPDSLPETGDILAATNATLAPAGIRIEGERPAPRIVIANATAFGYLREAFDGTEWAGGGWARALRALPGARQSNRTFRGMRSRCTSLPCALSADRMGVELATC